MRTSIAGNVPGAAAGAGVASLSTTSWRACSRAPVAAVWVVWLLLVSATPAPAAAPGTLPAIDVLIKNGTVYDGTGGHARAADVGIRGDRIVAVGRLETEQAHTVID